MDGASPVSGLLWNTLGYDQGERLPGLPAGAPAGTAGISIGAGNRGRRPEFCVFFFHKNGQTVFAYLPTCVRVA